MLLIVLVSLAAVLTLVTLVLTMMNSHAKRRRWDGVRNQVRRDFGVRINLAWASENGTLDSDGTHRLALGDGRWLELHKDETQARLMLPQWADQPEKATKR